jgi:hypothetical protein
MASIKDLPQLDISDVRTLQLVGWRTPEGKLLLGGHTFDDSQHPQIQQKASASTKDSRPFII